MDTATKTKMGFNSKAVAMRPCEGNGFRPTVPETSIDESCWLWLLERIIFYHKDNYMELKIRLALIKWSEVCNAICIIKVIIWFQCVQSINVIVFNVYELLSIHDISTMHRLDKYGFPVSYVCKSRFNRDRMARFYHWIGDHAFTGLRGRDAILL